MYTPNRREAKKLIPDKMLRLASHMLKVDADELKLKHGEIYSVKGNGKSFLQRHRVSGI